jgi:hypothetical protein
MAISYYFVHKGFTPEKYDAAMERLTAAGDGSPAGRISHVALESGGEIQVFDIWESEEQFAAFGATLVPILAELGIELGEPMTAPVYNSVLD